MEEFSMPQSILQIVSEKGFDGLHHGAGADLSVNSLCRPEKTP